MAEAFGVAAGAIGVVSLSIQLAESLQKVKDFCATVKNAPLHIAELMEEIEIMQDILSDLEDVCLSANIASSPNMHRCLKIAQRATKGLVSFSNELQVRIKKNRFRGGARLALSREEIKQMLSQLERTKSSLMLAYNVYREAVADDRHAVLMQAAVWRAESSTRKTQVISVSAPIHGSSTRDGLMTSPHKLMTGTTLFQVNTPRWLSNTVWRLEMRRSLLGLNVFTRTYGVVSCEAPIFRACSAGDDVEMQRLIESGLASPFDENEFGWSLWTAALQGACVKSLRCLHQYGAATSYADGVGIGSLNLFLVNAMIGVSAEPTLPYTSGRILQEDLKWLSDACCPHDYDSSEVDQFTGKTSLLTCQPIHADYVWIWRILSFPFPSLNTVQILSYAPPEDMLRYYDPQDHGGMTPLQIVAVYAASCLAKDRSEAFKALENTISGFITSGADFNTGDNCHTPLLLFLSTFYGLKNWPWEIIQPVRPRLVRRWLKWWLKALQNAGVDLVQYGSKATRALKVFESLEDPKPPLQHWHDTCPWHFNHDVVRFKITSGPNPEDWKVQAELPIEKYACDFWEMTQDQRESLSIPGGWIEVS